VLANNIGSILYTFAAASATPVAYPLNQWKIVNNGVAPAPFVKQQLVPNTGIFFPFR
jgi:hypothetical protein